MLKRKEEFYGKNISRLLLVTLLFSLGVPTRARAEAFMSDEASPEDVLEEYGQLIDGADGGKDKKKKDAAEPMESPGDREIFPVDFSKYQIVVDVFRGSKTRSVLGKFDKSYVDYLAPISKKSKSGRLEFAKGRFSTLGPKEFAVVSVDGEPLKANIVSGALEAEIDEAQRDKKGNYIIDLVTQTQVTKKSKKYTPNGNFKLTPIFDYTGDFKTPAGIVSRAYLPLPYLFSNKFEASTMFYGLSIFGGYLIHTTPHYNQLGRPASMGCVRQSSPDAQELFDLVVNRSQGRLAMIRIHKMDSEEAYTRLREIVYDAKYVPKPEDMLTAAPPTAAHTLGWLIGSLNVNYQHLQDFLTHVSSEYEGPGNAWWDPMTRKLAKPVYPMCGAYECRVAWGDPMKILAKKRKDIADKKKKAFDDAAAERLRLGIVDPIPVPSPGVPN